MRQIVIFLIIISVLAIVTIPALAAGPWKGKLIDSETKQPLEGAVVLAVWDRNYRTPTGGNSYFYEAKEVLTDKDGRFEIPSYITINLLPLISYIEGPFFTIFKPGYGSLDRADLEKYFLGEKVEPKEGEISGRIYRFSTGLIELPSLNTREERVKLFPGLLMYDEANTKNYIRLLNIEAIEIGLDPYPIEGGKVK